jgi:hypothetical protein
MRSISCLQAPPGAPAGCLPVISFSWQWPGKAHPDRRALVLEKGAQLLYAHDFEHCFIIKKAAFSLRTGARKRQIKQIVICGKEVTFFAIIINGYICKRIGQMILIGWIGRPAIKFL